MIKLPGKAAPLMLAFLWGCAAAIRTGLPSLPVPSLNQWPEQFQRNYARLVSFQARGKLTVESAEQSGTMSVKILWKQPDSLYLEAGGPLGVDLGKVFLGKNRFIIYNQYENHFIAGQLDDPYLTRLFNTEFTLHQLRPVLLGQPLFWPVALQLVDAEHGVFAGLMDGKKVRMVVDPSSGLLQKWELLDGRGVVLRQEFKRYRKIDGLVLPGLVRITHLIQKQRLSIFYEQMNVNKPIADQEMRILVPAQVEQLNLE